MLNRGKHNRNSKQNSLDVIFAHAQLLLEDFSLVTDFQNHLKEKLNRFLAQFFFLRIFL